MKSIHLQVLFIVCFLLFSCSIFRNNDVTDNIIEQKVESKTYRISVNSAVPMRMQEVHLTSTYDLELRNDSAFAFLPYYGVAHVAPMNPAEGGIKFSEKTVDYKIVSNKKKDGWKIQFKVLTESMRYDFRLEIYKDGRSSIYVRPINKDAITFYGDIVN